MASTTLYNALTGISKSTNINYFTTYEEFKSFIYSSLGVPVEHQFILLPFGVKLSKKTFVNMHASEVYVWDRRCFSVEYEVIQQLILTKDLLVKPMGSPLYDIAFTPRNAHSLHVTNQGWLSAIEMDTQYFERRLIEMQQEMAAITMCTECMMLYLRSYCGEVEKSYKGCVNLLQQLKEYSCRDGWEQTLDKISDLYVGDDCLADRISVPSLRESRRQIDTITNQVESQLNSVGKEVVMKLEDAELKACDIGVFESQGLESLVQQLQACSEPTVETVEYQKDIALEITKLAQKLYENVVDAQETKQMLQIDLLNLLKKVSDEQLRILELKDTIKHININLMALQKHEMVLAQVDDLPLVYGFHMIEKLRRSCWSKQVATLGNSLNKRLKVVNEREMKFRKTWSKNFGENSSKFGLEMEEQPLMSSLPVQSCEFSITAVDVTQYIEKLSLLGVSSEFTNLLNKNLKDALETSVSLPGTVEESETVVGYQARIRKLESLVHQYHLMGGSSPAPFMSKVFRQPTINDRMSMLNIMHDENIPHPPQDNHLVDELISENEALKLKIKQLETENKVLNEKNSTLTLTLKSLNIELQEKARRERTQPVISNNTELVEANKKLLESIDSWRGRYDKLDSMKDDLLANLAAKENEFIRERQQFQSASEDQNTLVEMLKRDYGTFVRILENVGLLLSKEGDALVISRVKGLREKESIVTTPKSDVYHEVISQASDDKEAFISSLNKLFANNLYEESLVKRFKDVETLAKRLQKEQKHNREAFGKMISIKNFQNGHLALFLPTRELNISSSSISFARQYPWAAFNTVPQSRFFLNNEESKIALEGREWVLGRINKIVKFIATEDENPFGLELGTVWYYLTASEERG